MTHTYLVVFEKGKDCWGAFAPDVPGTGGMGDTIEDARRSLLEGIGYVLEYAVENGLPIPEPTSTSVDFSEFETSPSESHYEVEWLTVPIPDHSPIAGNKSEQAA
jgi:predicted RNase H-like HicB family nuclease